MRHNKDPAMTAYLEKNIMASNTNIGAGPTGL